MHVIAKTVMKLNYKLEMTRKRKLSSSVEERTVLFLFGPEDSEGSKTVRAALLLDSNDLDRWGAQEFEPGLVSITDTEAVLRLNGQTVTSPNLKSLAEDALIERELTKSPDFFYIESWGRGGRDAALAPDPNSALMIGGGLGAVGLIFLLGAIRRFMRRHKVVEQQERLAQQVELARAAMIAQYRAQGLAVPDALTMPLKPRKSRSKMVMAVLLVVVVGSVGLEKLGVLDDALFALPLLALGLIMLGVRYVFKKTIDGVARIGATVAQNVVPERADPPSPSRYGPKFKPMTDSAPLPENPLRVSDNNTPKQPVIQSVPSLAAWVSAGLSAPALIKWAPFGIGVIIMVVSSKLFGTLGLSGTMGRRATPEDIGAQVASAPAEHRLPQRPLGTSGPYDGCRARGRLGMNGSGLNSRGQARI
ncbi:MAG: hypothetical protein Q8K08_04220 [Pseudotabrizicola sp.]|nr:hypothetical protein [Pseudotabrizicola sp.]